MPGLSLPASPWPGLPASMRHPGLPPGQSVPGGITPALCIDLISSLCRVLLPLPPLTLSSGTCFCFLLAAFSCDFQLTERTHQERPKRSSFKKSDPRQMKATATQNSQLGKVHKNSNYILSLSAAVPKPHGFQGAVWALASCPGPSGPGLSLASSGDGGFVPRGPAPRTVISPRSNLI